MRQTTAAGRDSEQTGFPAVRETYGQSIDGQWRDEGIAELPIVNPATEATFW